MRSDFGILVLGAALLLIMAKLGMVGGAISFVAGLRHDQPAQPAVTAPAAAPAPGETSAALAVPPDLPTSVWYATCAEAKKAGATPLVIGRPGYRSELDDNLDGVACDR